MKPTLQFRLSQHLTLTPQLQQSIRLLQLSTIDLHQEIDRILMENPILEREESGDERTVPLSNTRQGEESAAEPAPAEGAEDWGNEGFASWNGQEQEDSDGGFSTPDVPTLRRHLIEQLALINIDERDRSLAELLIDALDDDGYLSVPLEEIAQMFPSEAELEPEELLIALRHVQSLEPAGVGARSPAECLALQIRAQYMEDPAGPLALRIVEEHIQLLAHHDYARLKTATGASEEAIRAAQHLIQSLNPHPGAAHCVTETRYVTPDVIVRKVRNVWRAQLNTDAMPRLRINRLYAALAAGRRGGASGPLSTQLQEARWLIRNVQQRFETIRRVSQAIVERQRSFLEHGEVAMRPLILRDIAETLDLHESTISRVTSGKFMATPRGTYELKYFFGSHVTTDTGGAASSTAIRAVIRQLVAAENSKRPLSDSRISKVLAEQGFIVARRTVAKYRDLLQIPPVSHRKAF